MDFWQILYIVIATIFISFQGLFCFHYHGLLKDAKGRKVNLLSLINNNGWPWLIGQYWLNTFLSFIGWYAGYTILFEYQQKYVGNQVLFGIAAVIALTGMTGWLPRLIANISSIK